ncbi:hypothetical protein MVEN_02029100 [Mycena venus]|uniref:Protein kinase domain-containing protein n=1 Tax=Mycena venus TaxID=2733690 RepID=A0A8H7CHX2_9AGAR|nr:hypothetical protein MVEN_02029100 [Mycena venus]
MRPPLLFLSILIKAMAPHLPWLQQIFPTLIQLQFSVPAGKGQFEEFDHHGRDRLQSSNESRSDGGNDKNDPCQHIFVGDWSGELAIPSGYIITIDDVLSDEGRGIANVGSLQRNGVLVSAIAVKSSVDTELLSVEFSRYQTLEKIMGDCIPHCFGFSVMHQSKTAFLVTELVRTPVPPKHCISLLDQAERRAIYELLRKLHNRGWRHNDLVDLPNNTIHNMLWSDTGRPVLIGLETVESHTVCSGLRCAELRD